MIEPPKRVYALSAVLLLSVAGCGDRYRALPTITLETVQQLSRDDTHYLSYEIEDDQILVTVVDRHGDGHVLRLAPGRLAPAEAVERLDRKQAELSQSR